jgi:hypothetical protein
LAYLHSLQPPRPAPRARHRQPGLKPAMRPGPVTGHTTVVARKGSRARHRTSLATADTVTARSTVLARPAASPPTIPIHRIPIHRTSLPTPLHHAIAAHAQAGDPRTVRARTHACRPLYPPFPLTRAARKQMQRIMPRHTAPYHASLSLHAVQAYLPARLHVVQACLPTLSQLLLN